MRKKLQDYLPPILLETCEFPLLCLTGQAEMDALIAGTAEVMDAQFVTTAPLRGVERYEKIFGLVAKDTGTLEERRFAILSKMNAQMPYTVRSLRRMLAALCGEDGYSLEIDHGKYKLMVKMPVWEPQKLQAVRDMLYAVVPANMVYLVVTWLLRSAQANACVAIASSRRTVYPDAEVDQWQRVAGAVQYTAVTATKNRTYTEIEVQ